MVRAPLESAPRLTVVQTSEMPCEPEAPSPVERMAASGGLIGPIAFIGAWNLGAVLTERDYSPVDDAISRLAAVGADSRLLMTAGFVVFGTALPVYAWSLRRRLDGWAWVTAALAGIATLLVAATPVDRAATVDAGHALSAGVVYVTLAATPLLAAGPLARSGHRLLAGYGLVAGTVTAVSLALTATSLPNGLFQRIGLMTADTWIMASAVLMMAGGLGRRAGS